MHQFIIVTCLLIACAGVMNAHAADYYVSKTGNDGPNLCTLASPCLTIKKGTTKLTPGDTLYIRAGTYAEMNSQTRLNNIPNGTSWANPVRITAMPISGSGFNTVYETVRIIPDEGSGIGSPAQYISMTGDNHRYIIFEGLILDAMKKTGSPIFLDDSAALLKNNSTECGDASEATAPGPLRFLNMEITGSTGNGITWHMWTHDIEFLNMHVHHNGSPGHAHGYYGIGPRTLIDGGHVHHNGQLGIQNYRDFSGMPEYIELGCPLPTGQIIRNVRSYSNPGHGILAGQSSVETQVYNNLAYGNGGVGIELSSKNHRAWNNTAWGNEDGGLRNRGPQAQIRNNILQRIEHIISGGNADDVILSNNLIGTSVDPKFVDPVNGDFRLQADSPAINAGTLVPEVTTDIIGTTRPQGAAYDIGAYEFVTGTTPPGFQLANSGPATVLLGGMASTTIAASLTSGSVGPVSFSHSALPTGVTAAFNPTSCTPSCTTTLTFTAAPVSMSGTFPITVTAIAGGLTRTTTFSLNVNCPPTASQLVATTMTNVGAFARTQYSATQSPIWNRGVLHNGMMALYQSTGDASALAYVDAFGTFNNWTLTTSGSVPDRLVAGYAWTDSYAVDPQAVKIDNTRTIVQAQTNATFPGSLAGQYDYVDALFMGNPTFIRMAKIDNSQPFRDRSAVLFNNIHTTVGLFDLTKKLFYRDASYIAATSPNGQKVLWSRGNGWAYAGMARILQDLPPEDPSRAAYVATFTAMSEALVPIQRTDGFWNSNLDDPNHFGGPETSGTSLFTYGMAWGIRHGLLDSETYRPVVDRAWDGLVAIAVQSNGRLGYVQAAGAEPAASGINSSADFGYGVFLLAGSQMYQLRGGSPIGIGGAGE